jgi:hypothetical protein
MKKKKTKIQHKVEVIENELLPELSDHIWNDQNYYIHVAKYNGLNKFRHLTGGNKMCFPPLIQPTN